MAAQQEYLSFTFAPHVLEDLGVNLYTSVAKALVEFVANAHDADAQWVNVSFDGTNVHFTFGIPQGAQGIQGYQGPPGEVTTSQLDTAIATTAQNPTSVSPLSQTADGTYNPTQMQQVMDKLDELLAAAKRV